MIRDKLVDYLIRDDDNNLTFVVDKEGHKYLIPDSTIPDIGAPTITVSGLVVTVSGIDVFNEVNVDVPDVYVTVSGFENIPYEEIYVQGYNSSNFPNNTTYHPVPFTTYVVQPDEILHINSITAAQSKAGLSSLALYRDTAREREIPMYQDLHIVFPQGVRYYEGETLQIRFKPKDKRTRVQVFADGYITEE
jgi:hypothetical protein